MRYALRSFISFILFIFCFPVFFHYLFPESSFIKNDSDFLKIFEQHGNTYKGAFVNTFCIKGTFIVTWPLIERTFVKHIDLILNSFRFISDICLIRSPVTGHYLIPSGGTGGGGGSPRGSGGTISSNSGGTSIVK